MTCCQKNGPNATTQVNTSLRWVHNAGPEMSLFTCPVVLGWTAQNVFLSGGRNPRFRALIPKGLVGLEKTPFQAGGSGQFRCGRG